MTGEAPGAAETYCGDLARRFDPDRFLAAQFAPAARRPTLAALLAFNLEVAKTAEVVREPMLGTIRLQWWRDSLDGIAAGTPREHAVVTAIAEAIHARALPLDCFHRMIDAREADLDPAPPATLADLLAYCRDTSASLTDLSLRCLDARDAVAAGKAVGTAWALVGLMRAVPFHARARRVYLPADLIDAEGVSLPDLFELRPHPALAAAVKAVANEASALLARVPPVPRAALPALLPATLARAHLARLAAAGHDPFAPGFQAPLPSRAWRMLLAWMRGQP